MVPGGGPSLDGARWITSKHPKYKNRRKPALADHEELGRAFRKQFVSGLRRLLHRGKLRLRGRVDWLKDVEQRDRWLEDLEGIGWNVYIQGPPHGQSKPAHVLKYLARYMSGGPIADRRLISNEDCKVTFWARANDERNRREPFRLKGTEFVRRWSIHILPKGYTRSRSYGGYHNGKRKAYLDLCRDLLNVGSEAASPTGAIDELREQTLPKCKRCKVEMACVAFSPRPSWGEIFTQTVYREQVYCPLLHIAFGVPEAHAIGGYG